MHNILIALWVCATLRSVFAATTVGGIVPADSVWTAVESPYTVNADVTVEKGATLTIQPGTTVYFVSGVSLRVADGGRLLAEGTPASIITFTHPPNSSSRWGGFTIFGSIGSPETRIAYARFEFNGFTAIHSSGGTLFLDHVTFGDTDRQYLALDASSFSVSHCVFPSGTSPFEPVHGTGGIKSGGHGIIRRCFFGKTIGYNDAMDFTGGNRPGPIIHFYNNVFMGASDDILDLDGTDAWIEGNIFLHSHKNGAPDTAAAVSGGNYGIETSEITLIGNLFFDCDEAVTAKEGNFFTLINNTIVRITNQGGLDTEAGVLCVRDVVPPPPTAFGRGFYLEGNIIIDAPQLVRNYVPGESTITFVNNILPTAWTGPGYDNSVVDPMLKHIPAVAETNFETWADAQVLRDWFSLLPGSPGIGSGPAGRDKGGVVLSGASIIGEPTGSTGETRAMLQAGFNRTGNGLPPSGFPLGTGYTHFKWRLDSGPWSNETPIDNPISLTDLAPGSHHVEVVGKRDSGLYQDDPLFKEDASVTSSQGWIINPTLQFTSVRRVGATTVLRFNIGTQSTCTLEYKNDLKTSTWTKLSGFAAPGAGNYSLETPGANGTARFYRLISPTQP